MQIVLPGKAHATVHLDAAIAHFPIGLARIHFGYRHRGGGFRHSFFQGPGGIEYGRAAALGHQKLISTHVLHGLKFSDWLAELLARLGVLNA